MTEDESQSGGKPKKRYRVRSIEAAKPVVDVHIPVVADADQVIANLQEAIAKVGEGLAVRLNGSMVDMTRLVETVDEISKAARIESLIEQAERLKARQAKQTWDEAREKARKVTEAAKAEAEHQKHEDIKWDGKVTWLQRRMK